MWVCIHVAPPQTGDTKSRGSATGCFRAPRRANWCLRCTRLPRITKGKPPALWICRRTRAGRTVNFYFGHVCIVAGPRFFAGTHKRANVPDSASTDSEACKHVSTPPQPRKPRTGSREGLSPGVRVSLSVIDRSPSGHARPIVSHTPSHTHRFSQPEAGIEGKTKIIYRT